MKFTLTNSDKMFIVLGLALLMTMFSLDNEQAQLPQSLYTALDFVATEAPPCISIKTESNICYKAEQALGFLFSMAYFEVCLEAYCGIFRKIIDRFVKQC